MTTNSRTVRTVNKKSFIATESLKNVKVEWAYQQLHYRSGEPIGPVKILARKENTDIYYADLNPEYKIGNKLSLEIQREVVSTDIGRYMCQISGQTESYKST